MRELSEKEIDFISEDLRSRGIQNEDLRDNLLDHICVILENECTEETNLREKYDEVLSRFYKEELSEIQTETNNLLRFKHFYAMKNTLKIAGLATAVFTVLGAILKTFHLPGAGISIVLGGFFLSFIFLPLLIIVKFRDEDSKTDKAVFGFGLIVGIILSVGLIFKLMHWPTANILMISSTVIFTFVYVPLYFITRFNRPEIRFNTIVNSVLMFACGGIFFSLFDLSYSNSYSKQISENHRFIHDNALRLFDSNDRLINTTTSDKAQQLHENSIRLNEQLEKVAAKMVETKSTKNVQQESLELKKIVEEYNVLIKNIGFEELKVIEYEGLDVIDRINFKLALNTLARIQQQMAINENCFLTSSFASNLN